MKKLIFLSTLFFTVLAFQHLKAQQPLYFEYDEAGNCVRKYKTVTLPSPVARAQQIPETEDDTDDTTALEDQLGALKVLIFPNPTKGILKIEIQNATDEISVNFTLTEIDGKYITSGKSDKSSLTLDLSGFSSGVYLLRLTLNGKTEIYKIIKE